MTLTIGEYLGGIITDELNAARSSVQDPIKMLSSQNIQHVDSETVENYVFTDANAFTQADNKGVISGNTHIASLRDRTYTDGKFTFPMEYKFGFSVPQSMANKLGITPQTIGNYSDSFVRNKDNLQGISDLLFKHVIEPAKKKLEFFELQEVRDLFKNMGTASATAWQKPLGLPLVGDAASRADNWNYSNKLTSPLNPSSKRAAVNLFAGGQKTESNELYGASIPYMLLHASDVELAAENFMPETVVNVNYRDSSGVLRELGAQKMKMVGTYTDPDHPDDWVFIAEDAEIYRLAFVDPYGNPTGGVWTRIYVHPDSGQLIYEVVKRSIMVARTPLGIIKSIVPTE